MIIAIIIIIHYDHPENYHLNSKSIFKVESIMLEQLTPFDREGATTELAEKVEAGNDLIRSIRTPYPLHN